jgi:DNA polymerase III alpha subunit
MPAVAMTDQGNLFGTVQFYDSARARDIHPVIGIKQCPAIYTDPAEGHELRSRETAEPYRKCPGGI